MIAKAWAACVVSLPTLKMALRRLSIFTEISISFCCSSKEDAVVHYVYKFSWMCSQREARIEEKKEKLHQRTTWDSRSRVRWNEIPTHRRTTEAGESYKTDRRPDTSLVSKSTRKRPEKNWAWEIPKIRWGHSKNYWRRPKKWRRGKKSEWKSNSRCATKTKTKQ